MSLYKIYNPSVFQGNKQKTHYFEGWYFKQVSKDYSQVLAIIPGISLGSDPHSFIQLIDGKTGRTHYIEYDIDEFQAHDKKFEVSIGNSIFSSNQLNLDIQNQDIQFQGNLQFQDIRPWPVTLFRPGIMGWYRFVPYMECYHGVVSINHQTTGSFSGSLGSFNFDQGYGYIEKDWGKSFPEQWIWLHANCFLNKQTALMMSVAKIPWRGKFFVGFLAFLQIDDQLYSFFTYNRSKIVHHKHAADSFEIILKNTHHQLEISARQLIAGELKAPVQGTMERYIKESVDSEVSYTLKDKNGQAISSETSAQAGLEIVGEVLNLI